jgi:hypothetical protein
MKKLLFVFMIVLSLALLSPLHASETTTEDLPSEIIFDHSTQTYEAVDDITDFNLYLRFDEYDVLISTFNEGEFVIADNFIPYSHTSPTKSIFKTYLLYSDVIGYYYEIHNNDIDTDQLTIRIDNPYFNIPYDTSLYYDQYQLVLKPKTWDPLPALDDGHYRITSSSIEYNDSSLTDGWYNLRIYTGLDLSTTYGMINYKTGDDLYSNIEDSEYVHIHEMDSDLNVLDIDIKVIDGEFKIFAIQDSFDTDVLTDIEITHVSSNVDYYASQTFIQEHQTSLMISGSTLILFIVVLIYKNRKRKKYS